MSPVSYYTPTHLDVTKRIESGLTRFFESYKQAYAFASQKRSYVYPLTAFHHETKYFEYGFGVPA